MKVISTTQRAVENLEQEFKEEQELNKTEMVRTAAEINALIAGRLDDEHKGDRELFEGIAKAPSRADVVQALHRASELHIIASFGVRVEIGGSTGLYLWFRPKTDGPVDDDPLLITVQKWDLTPVMDLHWDAGISVIAFFLNLAARLRETPYWTGNPGFSPGEALVALSNILIDGQQAIVEGMPERRCEIFEVVEDDWVVGEFTLTNAANLQSYVIPYRKLNDCNWERHMQEKTWVNQRIFQKALDVAICLIADNIAEGALPRYLPGVWQQRSKADQSSGADD